MVVTKKLLSNFINNTSILDQQASHWINTSVGIGRRRHPFTIDIIGIVGGGDEGGIGIDEINFLNCSLPTQGCQQELWESFM